MAKTYEHSGIAFQYPENWQVEENDAGWGNRSVSVISPTGAFWLLSIHPSANSPERLATAAVDSLREEYPDLESESVRVERAGVELTGFEVHFFCLDFTNTASVLAFRDHRAAYAIFWQTEDSELEPNRRVFDAITTSFLADLGREA